MKHLIQVALQPANTSVLHQQCPTWNGETGGNADPRGRRRKPSNDGGHGQYESSDPEPRHTESSMNARALERQVVGRDGVDLFGGYGGRMQRRDGVHALTCRPRYIRVPSEWH